MDSASALALGLGESGVAALHEAGVFEYVSGILDDAADEEDAELVATIAPLLADTNAAADEADAEARSKAVLAALRGGEGPREAASYENLSAPV